MPKLADVTIDLNVAWTPKLVYQKLKKILPQINQAMPEGVFLQLTKEYNDDIPIVRILVGPNDPYTAERLGSLAFFSTERNMEWYHKRFGATDFVPHRGQVFVTYYQDSDKAEMPALGLNLSEDDGAWLAEILSLFR